MLRSAAVQSAAVRQLAKSHRINVSGIAAITGIPRGEVSRILNSSGSLTSRATQARQNISSKILSAWHYDQEFSTGTRRPRDLKIFGPGRTFEALVRKHGQGIPIRAILDELESVRAIQLLDLSQKIRAKISLAINPLVTFRRIKEFDAALDDFFLSLLNPSDAELAERVSRTKVWSGRASVVRKRFGRNAIAMLQELQAKLESKKERSCPGDPHKLAHLSLKITYREARAHLGKTLPKRRRNFSRNR